MQVNHPNQGSSLGISKALEEENRMHLERNRRESLTDAAFKKVPSKGANIWTWTRFVVSLYYNKLAVNIFGFLTGWHWYNRIDPYLILGALPTPSQIKSLKRHEKVIAVVNMCQEFPGYEKVYKELKINQIRLETPDFCIPALETIEYGVQKMIEIQQKTEGASVYLHCKAGRGRSAAIAICYLLTRYQLNPAQAQAILLEKRSQVDKDLYTTQEVRLYYKNLLSRLESAASGRQTFEEL
ncbi:protein-tyrosine phosphatase-like protein [Sporodiniella umbellata]|nr:protein-tyrosine phosphatase-like protein [Sporodiniella umbellata]